MSNQLPQRWAFSFVLLSRGYTQSVSSSCRLYVQAFYLIMRAQKYELYILQSFLSLLLYSVQSLPNALKSSKPSTTSGRESVSSHKSSKNAGQKRKLTALDEIRLVSAYIATYMCRGWTVCGLCVFCTEGGRAQGKEEQTRQLDN